MDHNGSIYLGPSEKPGKPPGFPRRNCGVAPFPSAAPSGAAPPGSGRPGPGPAFWPVGFPWIHFLHSSGFSMKFHDFHWLSMVFSLNFSMKFHNLIDDVQFFRVFRESSVIFSMLLPQKASAGLIKPTWEVLSLICGFGQSLAMGRVEFRENCGL